MGIGISAYTEIERIFIKFVDGRIVEKGMLTPEQGHMFFQKVVDEGKIGWDIIFERFPTCENLVKEDICRVKIHYLGPKFDEPPYPGSHPVYSKFEIAGKTILYQGKFYDLPATRRKR